MAWKITYKDETGDQGTYVLTVNGRLRAHPDDEGGFVEFGERYPSRYTDGQMALLGDPRNESFRRSRSLASWGNLEDNVVEATLENDTLRVPNHWYWDDGYGPSLAVGGPRRLGSPDIPDEDEGEEVSMLKYDLQRAEEGEFDESEGEPEPTREMIEELQSQLDKAIDAWRAERTDVYFSEGQWFDYPLIDSAYYGRGNGTHWENVGDGITLKDAWESWGEYNQDPEDPGEEGEEILPRVLRSIESYEDVLKSIGADFDLTVEVVGTFVDAVRELATVQELSAEVFTFLMQSRDVGTLRTLAKNASLPDIYLDQMIGSFLKDVLENPNFLLTAFQQPDRVALAIVGEEDWATYQAWLASDAGA